MKHATKQKVEMQLFQVKHCLELVEDNIKLNELSLASDFAISLSEESEKLQEMLERESK